MTRARGVDVITDNEMQAAWATVHLTHEHSSHNYLEAEIADRVAKHLRDEHLRYVDAKLRPIPRMASPKNRLPTLSWCTNFPELHSPSTSKPMMS